MSKPPMFRRLMDLVEPVPPSMALVQAAVRRTEAATQALHAASDAARHPKPSSPPPAPAAHRELSAPPEL